VSAFVLPVTDEPMIEAATGDEARAVACSPATSAFADRDRIVFAIEMVGVDSATRKKMLSEQLIEACASRLGQVKPDEGRGLDQKFSWIVS
tara:strand:- start:639 stop:911 length:273 start_codon:yes stop_codon:yes gene_type:complete